MVAAYESGRGRWIQRRIALVIAYAATPAAPTPMARFTDVATGESVARRRRCATYGGRFRRRSGFFPAHSQPASQADRSMLAV
jgi:hypothetical protein